MVALCFVKYNFGDNFPYSSFCPQGEIGEIKVYGAFEKWQQDGRSSHEEASTF